MNNDDVKNEVSNFFYSGDCDTCAKSICEKVKSIWERMESIVMILLLLLLFLKIEFFFLMLFIF